MNELLCKENWKDWAGSNCSCFHGIIKTCIQETELNCGKVCLEIQYLRMKQDSS
jgi:hypothetical protein